MRRSGVGSGGGHGSRPVTHTRAPKVEPKAHSIDPGAVHQIGTSQFLGREALRDGRGYSPPQGPTDNVAAVGVGGGRTVYKSGSQHGMRPAREMPEGRDILSEYGPESKRS
jgi:hypothetical protein